MTVEDKVDKLIRLFEAHDSRLDKVAETCARIDERTRQHEKRMDRADTRAGIAGGTVGGGIALIIAAIKGMFGAE